MKLAEKIWGETGKDVADCVRKVGILAINCESQSQVGYNLFDAAVVFLELNQHCVEATQWDSLCFLEKLHIMDISSPYNIKQGTIRESQRHMWQGLGR